MGVFSPTLMNRLSCQEYERRKDVKDLPKSVDWRKDGYVSDVKEQVIINNTETPPIRALGSSKTLLVPFTYC